CLRRAGPGRGRGGEPSTGPRAWAADRQRDGARDPAPGRVLSGLAAAAAARARRAHRGGAGGGGPRCRGAPCGRRGLKIVFLDVGGVLHLPRVDATAAALEPLGVQVDLERVFRAHHLGMAALDGGAQEGGGTHRLRDAAAAVFELYNQGYARGLEVPEGALDEALQRLMALFRRPGMWGAEVPVSAAALRRLADLQVPL